MVGVRCVSESRVAQELHKAWCWLLLGGSSSWKSLLDGLRECGRDCVNVSVGSMQEGKKSLWWLMGSGRGATVNAGFYWR